MCPLGLISSNFSIFSNDWWFIASLVVWIRDFLGTFCKSQLLDASTSISSNEITISVVKFPISRYPSSTSRLHFVRRLCQERAQWSLSSGRRTDRCSLEWWLVFLWHSRLWLVLVGSNLSFPFFPHMFDGLYVGNHPHLWWHIMTNYAIFMGGNLDGSMEHDNLRHLWCFKLIAKDLMSAPGFC